MDAGNLLKVIECDEPIYVPKLQYNPISALSVTLWKHARYLTHLTTSVLPRIALILTPRELLLSKCFSNISQNHVLAFLKIAASQVDGCFAHSV